MERQMTASDAVDLYEQMLNERAAKGARPMLYVSSAKDLECCVLMLLDKAPDVFLEERQRPPATEFGQHVRKV